MCGPRSGYLGVGIKTRYLGRWKNPPVLGTGVLRVFDSHYLDTEAVTILVTFWCEVKIKGIVHTNGVFVILKKESIKLLGR